MSKYEYEYDENVELPIYHSTLQSLFFNIFVNFLNFPNFLNIERFIIKIIIKKSRLAHRSALMKASQTFQPALKMRGEPNRPTLPLPNYNKLQTWLSFLLTLFCYISVKLIMLCPIFI